MSKIAYINRRFKRSTLEIIEQANEIIEEYQAEGYSLTVRQLYYQFVARDLIPNSIKSYIKVKDTISDARMAGLIDWEAIEDRTRNLMSIRHWDHPRDAIRSAKDRFSLNKWLDQDYYIEVWIEKEALTGVIDPICCKWDVPYFACRGYSSSSEQWRAGNRLINAMSDGREPVILHLGDHDPSGIDMTRDNRERLELFTQEGHMEIAVHRIALNMDQVEEFQPPPNPAKQQDSRFRDYRKIHGDMSWELGALNPRVISNLIETEILQYLDSEKWDETMEREDRYIRQLDKIIKEM